MRILPSRKSIYFIAAIIGVAGCASNPTSDSGALVQQASQAMASGSNEKAIDLLNQATQANPIDADAWARLAQAHFDTKDYPRAITAASEALARKPDHQEARGVQFVASMRLAMLTLSEIRKTSQLNGNNRAEAEQVVRSLRETLGETILLPGNARSRKEDLRAKDDDAPRASAANTAQEKATPKKVKYTPKSKPAPAASTVQTPPAKPVSQPAAKSAAAAPAKGGDPFGALR